MWTLGFPWSRLPPSSLVVDVGGGVGALTALLEKKHKALRYLVQDRAEVAEEGRRVSVSLSVVYNVNVDSIGLVAMDERESGRRQERAYIVLGFVNSFSSIFVLSSS